GVMAGQQTRVGFGLCYRTVLGNDTQGENYGYKLHIIYGAMASPSDKSYATINDNPEAITFSWEYTTTPVAINDNYKPTALIVIDSTKVDAANLAALEDILYGTTLIEPRLPMPAEIIELMGVSGATGDTGATGETGATGSGH
ncbi:MAG: hypothetical protein IJ726_08900, partial [Phocaeicola sp.]|nr:hypothetical protein [Phocaeicola sp.]